MKDHQQLISIVIPFYNVEAYIETCIRSVIAQTYTHLEIILVNDGSTDNSARNCSEFAKGDERITVINQANLGLSQARNAGTKVAKGEFVFYLDSDDYINKYCVEKLYESILRYSAEVAQANFYYDYPNHLLYDNILRGKDCVFSKDEAMRYLVKQEVIKNFAWGKLIRADIAKKHLFPVRKYFEDTFWMFNIINDCEKYVALAEPMLYYRQRSSSISGTFSVRNLDQLEGEVSRLRFIQQNYPHLSDETRKLLQKNVRHHRTHLIHLDIEDRKHYLSEIEKIEKENKFSVSNNLEIIKKIGSRIKNKILNGNQYIKINKIR